MYNVNQKRKWIIIVGVVIVFVAVGIFFFYKSISHEDNTSDKKDNSQIIETNQVGDASIDPENIDEQEEGTSINSSQLNVQQGKSNGIDISKWQGKIDWNKVKKSQIDFAYIRIGYRGENGVIYKDDNADYNIQQAQKAGILVGVYFYSTAINQKEAIEEAKWTLKCIEGYSISYPVVYDCEGYKHASSRTYKLGVKERTANALSFLNTISKAGYETMFYTSLSGQCDAWQYTNKGQVNGIEGNVDMVVCYFENKKAQPKNKNADVPKASVPLTDQDKIYSSVNEKVTAKSETNLRTLATTKSNIVTTLKNGETVTRIGIGSNGWSKLRYKNKRVYAITSYLTTDLSVKQEEKEDIVNGQKFEAKKDKVTAKDQVNLRASPSTSGKVVGTLNSGDFLERVAISQNGWSRLQYKGQVVYAITSYLSNEVIQKPQQDEPTQDDGFTTVNEKVTAKSETNLRDKPSVDTSKVVYTLKNGEYVKRIGIHSNGWSKLEYNGQIVYAISSYLVNE